MKQVMFVSCSKTISLEANGRSTLARRFIKQCDIIKLPMTVISETWHAIRNLSKFHLIFLRFENFKMNLKGIKMSVDWIHLAQDRALMSTWQ
jgi:hypothetical protein